MLSKRVICTNLTMIKCGSIKIYNVLNEYVREEGVKLFIDIAQQCIIL